MQLHGTNNETVIVWDPPLWCAALNSVCVRVLHSTHTVCVLHPPVCAATPLSLCWTGGCRCAHGVNTDRQGARKGPEADHTEMVRMCSGSPRELLHSFDCRPSAASLTQWISVRQHLVAVGDCSMPLPGWRGVDVLLTASHLLTTHITGVCASSSPRLGGCRCSHLTIVMLQQQWC